MLLKCAYYYISILTTVSTFESLRVFVLTAKTKFKRDYFGTDMTASFLDRAIVLSQTVCLRRWIFFFTRSSMLSKRKTRKIIKSNYLHNIKSDFSRLYRVIQRKPFKKKKKKLFNVFYRTAQSLRWFWIMVLFLRNFPRRMCW